MNNKYVDNGDDYAFDYDDNAAVSANDNDHDDYDDNEEMTLECNVLNVWQMNCHLFYFLDQTNSN